MTTQFPPPDWYRSPIDKSALDRLTLRSNWHGALQAGGHLAAFVVTAAASLAAFDAEAWGALPAALFLHGAVASFMINANHELVHGTVFAWAPANRFFLRLFSLFSWESPRRFWASHKEHHKYTLHPPADQEEVLPKSFRLREFLEQSVIDPRGMVDRIRRTVSLSAGRLDNEWDRHLFDGQPRHAEVIRWARQHLAVHVLVAVVALWQGWWLVPVLFSLAPAFGGVFFYLCNNTQHAGLMDEVADFRLCCRTIKLNPVLRFFYWHMNYHTEHHMYPSVPCYRLKELHGLIRQDLPPSPDGLAAAWEQILAAQFRQRVEPGYQFRQVLPQDPLPGAAVSKGKPLAATQIRPAQPAALASAQARGGEGLMVLECSVCGFVYDERLGLPKDGIAPGTRWSDVPDDWRCPDCGIGKSDFKMVRRNTARTPQHGRARPKRRVVIVGSGMAGHRVARELRALDAEVSITIVSEEGGDHYAKPQLSKTASLRQPLAALQTASKAEVETTLGLTIRDKETVLGLDAQRRELTTDRGRLDFDQLVLAVGSEPRRLAVAGATESDVLQVHSLDSYRAFRDRLEGRSRVLIVGAGLIGCEFANALSAQGHQVVLADTAGHPLHRLVPEPIGRALMASLVPLGVQFQTQARLLRIERRCEGIGCELGNGASIACDVVLSAIGHEPRIALARAAGLRTRHGICVDETLQTSQPGIYALGDCAEIAGRLHPFVEPMARSALALARTLAGRPTAVQLRALTPIVVKTPALPIIVAGDPGAGARWAVTGAGGDLAAECIAADGSLRAFALSGSQTRRVSELSADAAPMLA